MQVLKLLVRHLIDISFASNTHVLSLKATLKHSLTLCSTLHILDPYTQRTTNHEIGAHFFAQASQNKHLTSSRGGLG